MTNALTARTRDTLYDLPDALLALDAGDGCTTCLGEWVAVDGSACPGCGGDPDAPFARTLAAVAQHIEDAQRMALSLAKRLRDFEAEAEVLEEHARQTSERAAVRRRRVAQAKRWLALEMEAAGVTKVKDAFLTVYLQDNPASFEVVDETLVPQAHKRAVLKLPLEDVPDELLDYVTSTEVLKKPLMEHLEQTGEIPPGCEYRAKGATRHVRIRS